jgi:hypothetical protein
MSVTYHVAQVRTRLLECVHTVVALLPPEARELAEDALADGQFDIVGHEGARDVKLEVRLGTPATTLCAMWLSDLGGHLLPTLDDGTELVLLEEPLRPVFVTRYPWPADGPAA